MRVLFDGLQHLLDEGLDFFSGAPHLPPNQQLGALLRQVRAGMFQRFARVGLKANR